MSEQTKGQRINAFLEIAAGSPTDTFGRLNTELAQNFIKKALPAGTREVQQQFLIGLTSDVVTRVTGTSYQTAVGYETLLDQISGKEQKAAHALRQVGTELGLTIPRF